MHLEHNAKYEISHSDSTTIPSQNAIKCNTIVEMTFIHTNIDGSEKKATRQTLKNCS